MIGWLFSAAVGLITGVLSGFGIGGGSLLMLYLTILAGVEQRTAAAINLLYFLACAPAALISHIKNGLIEKKAVLWCAGFGVLCAAGASFLAAYTDISLLRRGFGLLLLYIGFREIFTKQ